MKLKLKYGAQIHYTLCLALAFSFSTFPSAVAVLVALLGINWVLNLSQFKFQNLRENFVAHGLVIYYLVLLLGLLNTTSENMSLGLFSLEVRLSFILLPFFVTSIFQFDKNKTQRILLAFVLGAALSGLYHVLRQFIEVMINDLPWYRMYGVYFASPLHMSYYAMYHLFALCVAYFLKNQFERGWINVALKTSLVILPVFIFLSTSRTLIIISIIIGIVLFYHYLREKSQKQKLKYIISVVLMLTVLYTVSYNSKTALRFRNVYQNLVTKQWSPENKNSTQKRIYVWKSSINLIQENWLFGVGTGDVKEESYKQYKKDGYTHVYNQKLNAHNQYLQAFISNGILGFLSVLFIITGLIYLAYNKRDLMLLLFGVLVSSFLLTESVWERQEGVVFFSFFAIVLSQYLIRNNDTIFTTKG